MGTAETFAVKDDLVSPMPEPIDGGGSQEFVWEGLAPLVQIQIAGNDGRAPLVSLGNNVVKIFILRRPERFEAEIVDDEKPDLGQLIKLPLIGVGGPCGIEL